MGRSRDVQLLLSLPSPPPRIDRPQVLRTKTHPPSQRTKGNVRDESPGKVFRTRCSTLGQEFRNEHEREKGEEDRCGGGRDICGIGGCVAAECAYTYVGGEMCMCMHACSGREHVITYTGMCVRRGSGCVYRGSLFSLAVVSRALLFPLVLHGTLLTISMRR